MAINFLIKKCPFSPPVFKMGTLDFFLATKDRKGTIAGICILGPGGNKIIFSSGARFQPIDFLNVTDPNRVFLNPVKHTLTLVLYEPIVGYDPCFT